MDRWERGSRAKVENLIQSMISTHVDRANPLSISGCQVSHVPRAQASNVLTGEGCGSLQIHPSSPGLYLLALEPGATPATWRYWGRGIWRKEEEEEIKNQCVLLSIPPDARSECPVSDVVYSQPADTGTGINVNTQLVYAVAHLKV